MVKDKRHIGQISSGGGWVNPKYLFASPEMVAALKSWAEEEAGLPEYFGIKVLESKAVPPDQIYMVSPTATEVWATVATGIDWRATKSEIDSIFKKYCEDYLKEFFPDAPRYDFTMGCSGAVVRYNKWYRRLFRPIRHYFILLFWKIGVIARARLKS